MNKKVIISFTCMILIIFMILGGVWLLKVNSNHFLGVVIGVEKNSQDEVNSFIVKNGNSIMGFYLTKDSDLSRLQEDLAVELSVELKYDKSSKTTVQFNGNDIYYYNLIEIKRYN